MSGYYFMQIRTGAPNERWDLKGEPRTFGRGDQVDVRVEDSEMSRQHFALIPQGDGWVIRDLNSKNGTWVNGERVAERLLLANDQVRAGHTTFQFCDDKPKGLRTVVRELEVEVQDSGKGFTTIRREIYDNIKTPPPPTKDAQ